jgi:hypothetical protein
VGRYAALILTEAPLFNEGFEQMGLKALAYMEKINQRGDMLWPHHVTSLSGQRLILETLLGAAEIIRIEREPPSDPHRSASLV